MVERLDDVGQLAVGADVGEHRFGERDTELLLDGKRELDEIERVGGQILGERHVGRQLVRVDAEVLGHQVAEPGLRRFRVVPRPPSAAVACEAIQEATDLGDVGEPSRRGEWSATFPGGLRGHRLVSSIATRRPRRAARFRSPEPHAVDAARAAATQPPRGVRQGESNGHAGSACLVRSLTFGLHGSGSFHKVAT